MDAPFSLAPPREGYPAERGKDLLRFLTCGSVDDGKSTLIGRLLYDCAVVLDDQIAALKREISAVWNDRGRYRFLIAPGRAGG